MDTQNNRMRLLSSLAKVFPECEPAADPACTRLSALKKEMVSFQAAYYIAGAGLKNIKVEVDSLLSEYITVKSVEVVPVLKPCNADYDADYLRTTPGLYPDLLRTFPKEGMHICTDMWRSLWVCVSAGDTVEAGDYPIGIVLKCEGVTLCRADTRIRVIDAELPPQRLIHTEWFHMDCLADYYHVPVFSERHWDIVGNFVWAAARCGCNMILTPLFTPPLDTAVDGERTTVQLVDVDVEEAGYSFDFSKLKRYIRLCKSCGIIYFEMSHLFSQWGAAYPPKILAKKGHERVRLFYNRKEDMEPYLDFLGFFLPRLIDCLKECGISGQTYFHISDEPSAEQTEAYRKAGESVRKLLAGFPVIDALSDYTLYKRSNVDIPVVAINHIEPFIEHGVQPLWAYYCTGQCVDVPNRFMAMPSYRNRAYGYLLYKYKISGILHWGYNFYNSQYSIEVVDPYKVTDAKGAFPAGDPFLVYPGPDGVPELSIRYMVLGEALQDVRACLLLEEQTSRAHVLELLEETLGAPLSFTDYPRSEAYYIQTRNRINDEIDRYADDKPNR